MFAVKDIMNVLQEDVHKLWKFHSEQRKMEKLSLAGLLLLLQLNTLHNLLRVWKVFTIRSNRSSSNLKVLGIIIGSINIHICARYFSIT